MNISPHRKKFRVEWRDGVRKVRRSFDSEADAMLFKAVADAHTPELAIAYFFDGLDESQLQLPALPVRDDRPAGPPLVPTTAAASPAGPATTSCSCRSRWRTWTR